MRFLSFSKVVLLSALIGFSLSFANVSFATYKKYHHHHHYHSYQSSIGDRVWVDENMNGIQDHGEKGAAHVKVLIGDCRLGKWLKWTKTDSNGYYSFGKLRPSKYSIVVFPEYHNPHFSGAKMSPYDKGPWDKDSDAKYMGKSHIGIYGQTPCVWLDKAQHKKNIDFGFYVAKANKRPDAVNDRYHFNVGDTVKQNIVTENDKIGDGCPVAKKVYGSLPPGISLAADGTLSGSPTKAGKYKIKYMLKDCSGDIDKAWVYFYVKGSNKLPDAVNDYYHFNVGDTVKQNIVTENDKIGDGCPVAKKVYGSLPAGVSLAADGTLSGSPTKAGKYKIKYMLKDCNGDIDKAWVYFYVKNPNKLPDAVNDHYHFEVGDTVNQNIVTENDDTGDGCPVAKKVYGELPPGVSLAADGTLSGSPTKAGEYKIKYLLKDCSGDIDKAWVYFSIKNPNKLPDAVDDEYQLDVGETVSQNIVTENDDIGDGCASVEIIAGTLPDGLSLATDGSLSGSPTTTGEYWIKYRLTDCNGDTSDALVDFIIAEKIAYCAIEAIKPTAASGHALWIPHVSQQLVFEPESVVTQILPNGDLTVQGYVVDGDLRFAVDMTFSEFMDDSANPKLELPASSYVQNGGTIDPATWDFYAKLSGSVTGLSGKWQGTIFDLEIRGPKAQIGVGANGKNTNFGLSSWFTAAVSADSTQVPSGVWVGKRYYGDINVDLKAPGECEPPVTVVEYCAVSAVPGQYSTSVYTHSVYLPAISKELRFDPSGFATQELPNGDLKVSGTVKNGALVFDLDWTFSDKKDSHSNPKLAMIDAAYVDNGGPIDPDTWVFYETLNGTLTGVGGVWDGVVLTTAVRMNPAQVGVGANGKTTNFGLSSWFSATITAAPNGLPSGFALNDVLKGDTVLDLLDPALCQQPDTGSWSGTVFEQVVDNSGSTSLEPLAGVTIELFSDPNGDCDVSDGVSLGVVQTNAQGEYSFANVPVGNYVAIETQPNGFVDVSKNEGGADDDVDCSASPNAIGGVVSAGEDDNQNDFVEKVAPELNDDEFIGSLRIGVDGNVLDNDLNITRPVTVELVSGEIPTGIRLLENGQVVGLTALTGTFVSTYRVTDATGFVGTAQLTIIIQ